jgi:hypothetical protein
MRFDVKKIMMKVEIIDTYNFFHFFKTTYNQGNK